MDIQRFKSQHSDILERINALRVLSRADARGNAAEIASGLARLSQVVTLHLAIEDRILYPTLEGSSNDRLAQMSKTYRHEMADIATPFIAFTRKWRTATAISADPDGFRDEANVVLRRVHERMSQEDREFYPAIEAAASI